jgi:hypothetical protein
MLIIILLQWKPLNVITLGQRVIGNNKRTLPIHKYLIGSYLVSAYTEIN